MAPQHRGAAAHDERPRSSGAFITVIGRFASVETYDGTDWILRALRDRCWKRDLILGEALRD